jgi:hypothetical protein
MSQMIDAAERVVTDLNVGRKREKESDPVGELQAARNLLDRAMEMREACDAFFSNEWSRQALKVAFLRKPYGSTQSEELRTNLFKKVVSKDPFDKFGKDLVVRLDGTIKFTSYLIDAWEGGTRIKDSVDYWYTTVLANRWLTILKVRPTAKNFDKLDEGTTFGSLPFQDFVKALPLDHPISAETVRTAVAFISASISQGLKTM